MWGDESKNIRNHQRIVMGRTSDILRQQTRAGGFVRNILWAHHEVQLTLTVPPTGNLGVLKMGPIVKRVTCQIHNISARFRIRHTFAGSILLICQFHWTNGNSRHCQKSLPSCHISTCLKKTGSETSPVNEMSRSSRECVQISPLVHHANLT